MKIKPGKYYVTRNGAIVQIPEVLGQSGEADRVGVHRTGLVHLATMSFMSNGRRFSDRESVNDLVEEREGPYAVWMCQAPGQAAMPAPSEEIARKWAATCNGRAFQVMEMI